MSTLNVGIIGLGFMGPTHAAAYEAARAAGHAVRVVALCDRDPARFERLAARTGNLATGLDGTDLSAARRYVEATALLSDPEVHAVSVCTHTDSHVSVALAALRAGKHVLVEKPVAIRAADVQALAQGAAAAQRICMPAMCMRFWPGWEWLGERVRLNDLGKVRSAVFQRLASPPGWADFYRDPARTGGALFDLHIHDADMICHLFGPPQRLLATGSLDHVTTAYTFASGPQHVIAEGGWDHAPGFPFQMRFVVCFEAATAEYDSRRPAPDTLTLTQNGSSAPVPLASNSGYEGEVLAFVRAAQSACAGGRAMPPVSLADALLVTRLLEAERQSLEAGAAVNFVME